MKGVNTKLLCYKQCEENGFCVSQMNYNVYFCLLLVRLLLALATFPGGGKTITVNFLCPLLYPRVVCFVVWPCADFR